MSEKFRFLGELLYRQAFVIKDVVPLHQAAILTISCQAKVSVCSACDLLPHVCSCASLGERIASDAYILPRFSQGDSRHSVSRLIGISTHTPAPSRQNTCHYAPFQGQNVGCRFERHELQRLYRNRARMFNFLSVRMRLYYIHIFYIQII